MTDVANRGESPASPGAEFLSEARAQLMESAKTIEHCLGQLDDSQIWWRPRSKLNSVGNLVLHLAGNLRQRILADIGGEPYARDRFGEFTERRILPGTNLLRDFNEIISKAETALAGLPAERLNDRVTYSVTAGTIQGTVLALIVRTLTHFSGHAQEILFMTRLQLGDHYAFKSPSGVPPTMRSESS